MQKGSCLVSRVSRFKRLCMETDVHAADLHQIGISESMISTPIAKGNVCQPRNEVLYNVKHFDGILEKKAEK